MMTKDEERAVLEQNNPQPQQEDVTARVMYYLSNGGLFNPELANHDAVRDLIIDCRNEIDRLRSLPLTESAAEKDAERYQQLLDDPATGRHLLLLLSEGRGDQASFRKMQDRIKASKDAAMQGDNGGS